jgi:hypothetical protein
MFIEDCLEKMRRHAVEYPSEIGNRREVIDLCLEMAMKLEKTGKDREL